MACAGLVIEVLFGLLHVIPQELAARVVEAGVHWNSTTVLNLCFIPLAVVLVVRFLSTGGLPMLRMMGGAPDGGAAHDRHAGHLQG